MSSNYEIIPTGKNIIHGEKSEEEVKQSILIDKAEVMKMRINADKVTLEDINSYEKLMQGSVCLSKSNANH